jgi:hypothetical protein
VLDVYEHYRFRAVQEEIIAQGKQPWDGFLETSDAWLKPWLKRDSGRNKLVRLLGG